MYNRLAQRTTKPVLCLEIEDSYEFRSPALKDLITERYTTLSTGTPSDSSAA